MTTLGLSMNRATSATSALRILAGYTYFGQFIDHDLTRDRTPLNETWHQPPCQIRNHRTPWLDLDSLYGDGPFRSKHGHLYAADGVSFRLGKVLANNEPFDLPLDDNTCMADVAEERNNENVIIRQLHAMFLKLHNAAVQELPDKLAPSERFQRARDRVRWQYQWLVRHDFLRTVCDTGVYDDVVVKGNRLIAWQGAFSIPVEFSQAAFRFGHSLVRDTYVLNTEPTGTGGMAGVPLPLMFANAHKPGPLNPSMRVDWSRFLGGETNGNGYEFAFLVDTSIVEPLFHLPEESIALFVRSFSRDKSSEFQLPVRTLVRGAASRLPTGEQVAERLSPGYRLVFDGRDSCTILEECGLENRTPLWYYILLEAELQHNGAGLGTIGSRLLAEVLEECLQQDPGSFLRNGSGWEPPPWMGPDGKPIAVRTLLDLACVVGLATRAK
jgi:hypothetical protein